MLRQDVRAHNSSNRLRKSLAAEVEFYRITDKGFKQAPPFAI
jgi:hypothetical protein